MDALLHLCTYFDSAFLDRGIALIESARIHQPEAIWHVLCLDESVRSVLEERFGASLHYVELSTLEATYPELAEVREKRSQWEYFLTCRCHFIEFLMQSEVTSIVCLDGDFYFFAPLGRLFEEEDEVLITPHRFASVQAPLLRYGKFNAGFTAFRKGNESQKILRNWCHRCLEDCDSLGDGEKYTDQKYLDAWEGLPGVRVLQDLGINAAPWNQPEHPIAISSEGILRAGEKDVLKLFHFHGIREFYPACWLAELERYGVEMSEILRVHVYLPYLRHIEKVRENLGKTSHREITLLPCSTPPPATDPAQMMAIKVATAYGRSLAALYEKENVIHELREACEERLEKVKSLRRYVARLERTSLEYWLRRLTGKSFFKS